METTLYIETLHFCNKSVYYIYKMFKLIKDYTTKFILGGSTIPRGLYEVSEYFRNNDPIKFQFIKENGYIIAKSTNFRHGVILTSGKNIHELDDNIKDAILTSFSIPSSYAKEASIKKVGTKEKEEYALA